jgi:hypothetical protein
MHAQCIAVASVTRSAGLLACPATCTRRCQLHNSFSRAGHPDVQRVVDEEADLGCKSTPELACDAVTPGTLSAGVLGRFEELAHLLCTCSSAASQRDLLKCSLEFLSCSATFEKKSELAAACRQNPHLIRLPSLSLGGLVGHHHIGKSP